MTIFPGLSDDITTGQFNVLGTEANASVNGTPLYSMPEPAASHGTIMPITSEEYDNLMKKYNSKKYTAAIKKLVNKAVSLSDTSNVTSDITLPAETTEGNAITWTSSNEAVVSAAGKVTRPAATAGDATVELTATFAINGNGDVRRQEGCTKTFTVTVKAADPVVTPPADNNNNNNNNSNNTQPAPANYTVTFVGADNAVVATQTVTSGTAVAKPADPARKKYTFKGWYLGTTAYDFAAPVTADLTITAKWAKVSVSKAKLSSAKNSKKKTLVVKAKKTSGAAGYEYIIATDKKFKKNVKKSTTTKTSVRFKKLKKGKTYYVKVRAYKKDSANSKVYGSYSAVKKVKIKK